MRMRKTMFSALLIFAMLISVFTFGGGKVYADQRTFTNVQISPEGVLTWDPVPDVAKFKGNLYYYEVSLKSTAPVTGSSPNPTYQAGLYDCEYDLFKRLTEDLEDDGVYSVTIKAKDNSGNDYKWTGTYSFINTYHPVKLPAVYNIRWEGDYIVWDFDQSACPMKNPKFKVVISMMENGHVETTATGRTTEYRMRVGGYVTSGTHDYKVTIMTENNPVRLEYKNSDKISQDFYNITAESSQLTGLKYENGILSWDAFPDTSEYSIDLQYVLDGSMYYKFPTSTTNSFDLAKYLGESPRKIAVGVTARKTDGNKRIDYALTDISGLVFDYDFKGYSLSVFGKRMDLNSNLDDVLGDGGSIKYIPTENKVIIDSLANDDLAKMDSNVFDRNTTMFETEGSLTIDGRGAFKLNGAFINMGLDLTFTPNCSFTVTSENSYVIFARNVWLQGGSYKFKGKGPLILSTDHYITISEGTQKLEVESTTSEKAMQCGFENPDGKITIPDSMKIYLPENGRLSKNLKTILQEDSFIASKVYISTTAPSPTPTTKPTATPTAAPTAASTVKPTAKPTAPTSKPVATSKPAAPTAVVTSAPSGATTAPQATSTPKPTAVPAEKKSQILSFVERLYSCVLGREPEAEGAAYWSDELYGFRRTGAEVAQGFIFSEEFVNRNTTDEQFVTILYNTFFNREPEENGMAFWLEQLATGSMDRVSVANGFIYSQEWADTCASYGIRSGGDLKPSGVIAPTDLTYAFVERMYTTALGRGFDEEGKQYWASELANFNVTGEFVGAAFFLSEEMNGYGLSDEEYLRRLYVTFMNREPDLDGQDYWLTVMASGTPRAEVVFGFMRSAEFTEKCIEARILPY